MTICAYEKAIYFFNTLYERFQDSKSEELLDELKRDLKCNLEVIKEKFATIHSLEDQAKQDFENLMDHILELCY